MSEYGRNVKRSAIEVAALAGMVSDLAGCGGPKNQSTPEASRPAAATPATPNAPQKPNEDCEDFSIPALIAGREGITMHDPLKVESFYIMN